MWGSAIFDSSVQRLCPAVQASGVVDRLVFVLSGSFEIWQHVCNTGSGFHRFASRVLLYTRIEFFVARHAIRVC